MSDTFKPEFPYLCDSLGSNYRMTEIQAAMGDAMLPFVLHWVEMRRAIAKLYDNCFKKYSFFRVPEYPEDAYHSFFEYYVFYEPSNSKSISREDLILKLRRRGIYCSVGSCPLINKEKVFGYSTEANPLTNAEELARTSMQFPCFPTLDIVSVIDKIEKECDRI